MASRACAAGILVVALAACAHPPGPDELARPARAGWTLEGQNGCWVWNPSPRLQETVTWSGRCDAAGRATGVGVLEWNVDERWTRYEGSVRDGRPDGRGTWRSASGDRYEGEYRAGQRHGVGVYTFANGGRYEGDYRDGKPNGLGTWTRGDNTYTGTWIDGCFRRAGHWAWANTTAEACGFVPARGVPQAERPAHGGIEGPPITLDARNQPYAAYLEQIKDRIRAHWGYPCLTNPATRGCDFLRAVVIVEIGILKSGQLQYVEVRRTSGLAVYDEYALDAIKRAAPYPEVPAEVMAAMNRQSTGLAIGARLSYVTDSPSAAPPVAAAPASPGLENRPLIAPGPWR